MLSTSSAVLIADDFTAFRSFIRSKLQKNGFNAIVEATDGVEAVAKAVESHPDLVLLDIGMPGLNGIEAAARIRLLAPQSKVIFVSQNTDPVLAHSALSDGAEGYVLKSRVDRDLMRAIEAVVDGKKFISPGLRPPSTQTFS